MTVSTRRIVMATLIRAGAASMLPSLIMPLHAAPPLRLPDTPMRLERLLQRGIGDRAAITVRRSWQVRCAQQGRGITVSGEQIASEVSAPPNLAALARIEERRDTSAMFPLMLAEDGMILSPGNTLRSDTAVADALRAAEAMIADQPVAADERARYRQYLAQVHQAGAAALDTLPPDLLFPIGTKVQQSEAIALPDGLIGHFSLIYVATAQADAPWLQRAERRVMTDVAKLTRGASEVWTFTPM